MANRIKWTPEKDDRFFEDLAAGQPVGDACRAAGYGRTAAYDRRAADPAFAARWDDAIEAAVERMEAEADRRAVEGTDKPVFHNGIECGYVRQYSDTLLIFRLKALKPEKYRERIEHTGKDGGELIPAEVDHGKMALALLTVLRSARPQAQEEPATDPIPPKTARPT